MQTLTQQNPQDTWASSAKRDLQDFYLSDAVLPYHGLSHPAVVERNALKLVERAQAHGIAVDVEALQVATYLHDALSHLNSKLLGFETPEELAGTIAYNRLVTQGKDSEFATKVKNIILSTDPRFIPSTPEEKIMRAADLGNLGQDFMNFAEATLQLYREAEYKRKSHLPWQDYLPLSYKFLQGFMWPMIELTPQAWDGAGRSMFHKQAMGNLLAWTQHVYPESQIRVHAHMLTRSDTLPHIAQSNPGSPEFAIIMHHDEQRRHELLSHLRESMTKPAAPRFGFVIPNRHDGISLPDESCNSVHLDVANPTALQEAARALKPGGTLFVPKQLSRELSLPQLSSLGFEICSETSPPSDGRVAFVKSTKKASELSAQFPKLNALKERGEVIDSLRGWSAAFEDLNDPLFSRNLVRELQIPMAERYQKLQAAGLLHHTVLTVRADKFLDNPGEYLAKLPGERLFPFIEPQPYNAQLPRFHNRVVPHSDIVEKVKNTIGKLDPATYMITLQPAYSILYTGNVIVRKDGTLIAEFCKGTDIPSRQHAPIAARVTRDPLTGIFRWNNPQSTAEAEEMRATLFEAIKAIPGEGQGRNCVHQRGYYELALGRDPTCNSVIPLFFDFRTDSFFVGDR